MIQIESVLEQDHVLGHMFGMGAVTLYRLVIAFQVGAWAWAGNRGGEAGCELAGVLKGPVPVRVRAGGAVSRKLCAAHGFSGCRRELGCVGY